MLQVECLRGLGVKQVTCDATGSEAHRAKPLRFSTKQAKITRACHFLQPVRTFSVDVRKMVLINVNKLLKSGFLVIKSAAKLFFLALGWLKPTISLLNAYRMRAA